MSKTVKEMRAALNTYTVGELKGFIKEANIEKFSLLSKPELIDLMVKPKHRANFMNIDGKEGAVAKGRPKKGEVREKKPRKGYNNDERNVLQLVKKFNEDFGETARKGFKLNTEAQIKKLQGKLFEDVDNYEMEQLDLDDEDSFNEKAKEHLDKAKENEKEAKKLIQQAKDRLKKKK